MARYCSRELKAFFICIMLTFKSVLFFFLSVRLCCRALVGSCVRLKERKSHQRICREFVCWERSFFSFSVFIEPFEFHVPQASRSNIQFALIVVELYIKRETFSTNMSFACEYVANIFPFHFLCAFSYCSNILFQMEYRSS